MDGESAWETLCLEHNIDGIGEKAEDDIEAQLCGGMGKSKAPSFFSFPSTPRGTSYTSK